MIKEKKPYNIYILGNPILREDSIPIQIKPKLMEAFPHIQFIELDPTENFPDEKFLILIDTVINSKKIILIQDLDSLQDMPQYTMHDFDLAFNLKIINKMSKLKEFMIIGLAPFFNDALFKELRSIITNLPSEND